MAMIIAPSAKRCRQDEVEPDCPPSPEETLRCRGILTKLADLHRTEGMQYDVFCDCVVISVKPEGYDEMSLVGIKHEKDVRESIELVPGKYFVIGIYEGVFCYRQESPEDGGPNMNELFLWFNKAPSALGWYVSSDLNNDKHTKHYGWGPQREVDDFAFPLSLHCPYYNKKANPNITLQPFGVWVQDHIEELVGVQIEQYKAERRAECQEVKQPSGWMNRAMPLIGAVLDENWQRANELASQYARMPSIAKHLPFHRKGHHEQAQGSHGSSSW